MKQIVFGAMLLVMTSSGFAENKGRTFTGEIMDKQCAQMQSHENMMSAEGAKDATECALKCVKDGGSFALLDSETKKVYPIDDAKKVREYAGKRVQVSGSYDENADVLHIKSIAPAK